MIPGASIRIVPRWAGETGRPNFLDRCLAVARGRFPRSGLGPYWEWTPGHAGGGGNPGSSRSCIKEQQA